MLRAELRVVKVCEMGPRSEVILVYWLEECFSPPPNSCSLGSCECDLNWKEGLCRCNQVKMRSYWSRVGPQSSMTVVLPRGTFGPRHRGRGHVMTEAETRVSRNGKDSGRPPDVRESQRSSLETSAGARPC